MRQDLKSARSKAPEEIYRELKADILTFAIMPGENISENTLAAKYNTSRTTIRSVLQRLEGEQLVQVLPQKGSFVTYLNQEYIWSAMFVRCQVEADVLCRLSRNLTPDTIAQLEHHLWRQKTEDYNIEVYLDMDTEYHRLCFDSVVPGYVWEIMGQVDAACTRMRRLRVMSLEGCYDGLYAAHYRLFELLKAGDETALRRCLQDHVFGDMDHIRRYLGRDWGRYFETEFTNNMLNF